MRYLPSNIKVLKNKIKLLKKCTDTLSRDAGHGQNAPTVSRLQESLAKAVGYHAWAELIRTLEQASDGVKTAHITSLREAAKRLAQSLQHSELIAAGLLLRIGITPEVIRAESFDWLSFQDAVRFVDLITERLHETTDDHERQLMLKYLKAVELQFNLNLNDHAVLWTYVVETQNLFSPPKPGPSPLVSQRHFDAIAASLPKTGIFLLSGATGTYRSRSAISLMKALRARERNLFPISHSIGIGRSQEEDTGIVLIEEVLDPMQLSKVASLANSNLVIIKIAADWPDRAKHALEVLLAETIGRDKATEVTARTLVGGIHHAFKGAAQSLLWWTNDSDHLIDGCVLYSGTRTWHLNAQGLVCSDHHGYLQWLVSEYLSVEATASSTPGRDANLDLELEVSSHFLNHATPPSDLRGSRLREKVRELIVDYRGRMLPSKS
jgi:hypothetical protein